MYVYQSSDWSQVACTVSLTISNARPRAGDTVTLEWNIIGAAQRIRKLTITLEGFEKTTHSVGTRTRTDTYVFYKKELLTVRGVDDFSHRKLKVDIPEKTMHSFESNNNSVEWAINVHGDIAFWADIFENFPITVLPKR